MRAALIQSNATPGTDTINFAIGSGLQTIMPVAVLPVITDPMIIDATTQPLYDYQGDKRTECAEIIVRRRYIGSASNDLGFKRTAEGYTPIVSEYDQRTLHQGKFIPSLRVAYNERVVGEMGRRLRGSLRRETQGAVVKLKIRY